MADETGFLATGPQPQIGPDIHIIDVIGRVGDALVYAARDGLRQARLREYAPPGLVRRVADGTLEARDTWLEPAWRDGLARFRDQGDRLIRLAHPGIASTWRAIGPWRIGAPVGEPIGAALAAGLQPSPQDVVRIARELAAALAAAHQAGLTHLDIGPDTVSLAAGHVQITDFTVDNRPYMPLLETQAGLVRPGYSPIEHHDGGRAEPLSPAADVYAACALIYRLVTGRPPAPWQDRWRDPSVSQLAARDAYPAEFIEAVRRGLAIEPEERWPDGAALLEAMGLGSRPIVTGPIATGPAEPVSLDKPLNFPPLPDPVEVRTEPPTPPAARSGGGWLLPTLIALIVLLSLAVLALYAIRQGWLGEFGREEPPVVNQIEEAPPPLPRPEEPAVPEIAIGATVNGTLTSRDFRSESGQIEDRYSLQGRAGDRIEIRLSSSDFDPFLRIAGPGLEAENDDDRDRNSRLVVTLPEDGGYTIHARGYGDATGAYMLEVNRAPPADEPVPITPALLDGRWRLDSDPDCEDPAIIVVDGMNLTYRFGSLVFNEQILSGEGRTIRTRVIGGPSDGVELAFTISPDGQSYTIDDEIWRRCGG